MANYYINFFLLLKPYSSVCLQYLWIRTSFSWGIIFQFFCCFFRNTSLFILIRSLISTLVSDYRLIIQDSIALFAYPLFSTKKLWPSQKLLPLVLFPLQANFDICIGTIVDILRQKIDIAVGIKGKRSLAINEIWKINKKTKKTASIYDGGDLTIKTRLGNK